MLMLMLMSCPDVSRDTASKYSWPTCGAIKHHMLSQCTHSDWRTLTFPTPSGLPWFRVKLKRLFVELWLWVRACECFTPLFVFSRHLLIRQIHVPPASASPLFPDHNHDKRWCFGTATNSCLKVFHPWTNWSCYSCWGANIAMTLINETPNNIYVTLHADNLHSCYCVCLSGIRHLHALNLL